MKKFIECVYAPYRYWVNVDQISTISLQSRFGECDHHIVISLATGAAPVELARKFTSQQEAAKYLNELICELNNNEVG